MKRTVLSIILTTVLLTLTNHLCAAVNLDWPDITIDQGQLRYTYFLNRSNMLTNPSKFYNNVHSYDKVAIHQYDTEIHGIIPDTGENSASFEYIFDFSNLQPYGGDAYIDTVELRDKISLINNILLTEQSTITTQWSTDGVNYNTFNTADTPSSFKSFREIIADETLTMAPVQSRFYYKVTFTNTDADGFDLARAAWNRVSTTDPNFFRISFALTFPKSPPGTYAGGEGSESDPFRIADASQLDAIGNYPGDWDKHFILVDNINMRDYRYSKALIAADENNSGTVFYGVPFSGCFDGKNYAIDNFDVSFIDDGTQTNYFALFGRIDSAKIKKLKLRNARISANPENSHQIAALVGRASNSLITNCHVSGTVSGQYYVGGIAGAMVSGSGTGSGRSIRESSADVAIHSVSNTGGLVGYGNDIGISECYTNGVIINADKHMWYIGGIIGSVTDSQIDKSYSNVNVFLGNDGTTDSVGGFVGFIIQSSCSDCYSTGDIIANNKPENRIGGFIGEAERRTSISNCYSTTAIKKTETVTAGFVGKALEIIPSDPITFNACFWDTTTSGTTNSVGTVADPDPVGIYGYPTIIMKLQGTYTTSGWDFINETANGTEDIWAIIENQTYPMFVGHCLSRPAGDINGDCKVDFIDFALLAKNWLESGNFATE